MPTEKTISRRSFLKQLNCAAIGSAAILNGPLNFKLTSAITGQGRACDNKALVCIFLSGGMDSFNLLVPWEQSAYDVYSKSRGAFGTDSGLALDRDALRQLSGSSADYGLHPACANLQAMANGTDKFAGKRRLAFIANVGTLVQSVTKAQFNAWESGKNTSLPVPQALFSHSNQVEQWQTAIPQGLSQPSGWAGRSADMLDAGYNSGLVSMNVSFAGKNIFQAGNSTYPLVVTPSASCCELIEYCPGLFAEHIPQSPAELDNSTSIYHLKSANVQMSPAVDALFPPGNHLATTLKAVVKAIKIREQLGLRRQMFFVNYGGWDHHGELLNTQAGMLSVLDAAIGAYQLALEQLGLQDDVITFTSSDFGRTLRSNGRGTDHAWGGNAMVFGGKIDGGKIFGTYPNLTLDGPDDVGQGGRFLPSTAADLYFAELLRWFGVSADNMSYVLPNIANFWNPGSSMPPLGFVKL